ncbi:MAG: amino acid transporter [Hyphomicrobium sp. 32-62-53]|nr:MAG: amino acid transporter [Hyphomicrobium sp. 12-62-95]OYY00099.1 MAG: amino acid transporter [Hyphomicrobium sp. 32-62-53]
MLGSGIYALVGKAAGVVGNAVWLSFVAALCAALLTALSYASLGSRYPRAGGASYVTDRAFGWPILSFAVGLALVCSGMTSVATQSRVFASNLASLFGATSIPVEALALGFLLITAGIVFRGIRESMWVNIVCTLVEAAGLLIVIAVSFSYWGSVDYFETPASTVDGSTALLILQGSILTFFAFIGFEDTYNVAEEVKNPETTIPIALVAAMLLATVLYIAVAISAVSVVPYQELSAAPAPLAAVMEKAAPAFPAVVLVIITMFAVANTALLNYVTASRMLYGMSNQQLLPRVVGRVHPTRQTPHIAILILLALLAPLMLSANISDLASATVLLLLFTFAIVNAALFVLKRRPGEAEGRFEIPAWVPALGCLLCLVLIVVRVASGDIKAPLIAGILIAGILGLYWLLARQKEAPQT